MVDDWSQEVANMEAYCKEVDDTNQELEYRLNEAIKKHQADVAEKDEEIMKLKAEHKLAIAANYDEIEKLHQACIQKDSAPKKTVIRATTEREDFKTKANMDKRKILKVHRIKTDDLKAKAEALEVKNHRMAADLDDAMSENEKTIVSLKARNQHLEKQHDTMS